MTVKSKLRTHPPYAAAEQLLQRTGSSKLELLRFRHSLLKAIRDFFYDRGYLEVETPNLMKTAAPDPNIEPLNVYIGDEGPFFLHTSPEMGMKKLLQVGHERIFQICKVYRVEESEEIHNTEFTMLEWYREGTYLDAMGEVEDLVTFVVDRLFTDDKNRFARPWRVHELSELFTRITGINPFELTREGLCAVMESDSFLGIDEKDTWNDLFFKLFIQEVEPKIPHEAPYFIKDWPLSVSTMAKRKDENRVERFELYINNLEIANGYTELLDTSEQRQRFDRDNNERIASNKQTFSIDEAFLMDLDRLHGTYAGVSVGVDRLLMVLMGKDRIEEVLINRVIP
jgi:lysyl-tRNA synthetase class 2